MANNKLIDAQAELLKEISGEHYSETLMKLHNIALYDSNSDINKDLKNVLHGVYCLAKLINEVEKGSET